MGDAPRPEGAQGALAVAAADDQVPLGQFQDGSGFGTGMQTPAVPASAHDLHGPWQAVAQQTP